MYKTRHIVAGARKMSIIFTMVLLLYNCSSDILHREPLEQMNEQQVVYPETIKRDAILPEAELYYENLGQLVKWYSKRPEFFSLVMQPEPAINENTVLRKLHSMVLIDSTGKKVSLFDLDKQTLNDFLAGWVQTEAYELTQKVKKDTTGVSSRLFIERNRAFSEATGNLKSENFAKDPYVEVRQKLDEYEKEKLIQDEKALTLKSEELTDDGFWAKVVANGILSSSVIHIAPNALTRQTFIDHLRPNIKKGRILIALPGGWTTTSLIVFYPNKKWFDVGHVAIISKNNEEIPDSIDRDFSFTIGTGVDGTKQEVTEEKWCVKHGLAFLCQVSVVKWEMYKDTTSNLWKWRKIITDAEGDKIISKAGTYLGVSYCNVAEVFFSKWAAPKRFICSSLAWYCARETSGLDISDWWNPSIYPVDIFFSENIRIVDDTLD